MEKGVINDQAKLVAIGGSAGSLKVVIAALSDLQRNLKIPVVIVLHRKNDFESNLADLLTYKTGIKVKEAEDKEEIKPGIVYLAPADYHLLIEKDFTFSLDDSEKVNYSRPSIDVTFQTAADAYGSGLTGILLSGANADGVEGLMEMHTNKGIVAVQDPASAQVPYMPQQAMDRMEVDYVLKIDEIAPFINTINSSVD
jgi:two-component system chemotaxis response regulator CheB